LKKKGIFLKEEGNDFGEGRANGMTGTGKKGDFTTVYTRKKESTPLMQRRPL